MKTANKLYLGQPQNRMHVFKNLNLKEMARAIKLQRIEGLAIAVLAAFAYFANGLNPLLFFIAWLALDIFMIGYIVNPTVGQFIYNLGYMMLIPSIIGILYIITSNDFMLGLACVWFVHNGFARALGYGLKLDDFRNTHLGTVGRDQG